jgi:hypothetical protein
MLRGVADDALINYVQNPSGEVPSYLALSELQRRKDTRAQYEAQKAPETSVAEDLEQQTSQQDQGGLAMLAGQSQPQGISEGVAGMPVDENMYQDKNFAAGGIIAFDDGGDVKNYAGPEGSYVRSEDYDPMEQYRKTRQLGAANLVARKYNAPTQSVTEAGIKTPYDDAIAYYKSLPSLSDKKTILPGGMIAGEGGSQYDKALSDLEARRAAWLSGSKDPYTKNSPIGSKLNPYGTELTKGEVAINDKLGIEGDKQAKLNDKKHMTGLELLSEEEKAKLNKGKPKVEVPVKDKPINVLPEDETKAPITAESQIERLKKLLGDDPSRTELKDKLSAMEKRAAKQEELAPWMALTEAGFKTMQGTSPYALANVGAGAEAGLKSYGAAQDKLAALEEKRYALMNEAAKADRAEKLAVVSKGFESEDAALARAQKDRIANMNADLEKEKLKITKELGYAKINSDAKLLQQANFGLKDQAAIDKYVKTKLGDTNAMMLSTLKNTDPTKLTPKRKQLLDSLLKQEQSYIQEAEQKFSVNALSGRAKPGMANTQFKSSDFTVEALD